LAFLEPMTRHEFNFRVVTRTEHLVPADPFRALRSLGPRTSDRSTRRPSG
jgi:hypothetical protein